MNEELNLSIVVPVYNSEEYLSQCVDSILRQSYADFEVILVDDGSTDRSPEICDTYTSDQRVKVIHQNNTGNVKARIAGTKLAKGKYVGYVDSDDWIDETMFMNMLEKADKYHCDIVCCGYTREDIRNSVVFHNQSEGGFYDKKRMEEELYPGFIAYGTDWINQRLLLPNIWNKIFKREIILKAMEGIRDGVVWGGDLSACYPAIMMANSIYIINQPYYHYRRNIESMTFKRNRNALKALPKNINGLLSLSENYDYILDKQIGYYATYACSHMLKLVFGMKIHKTYLFPFQMFEKHESIAIYGAGAVGWSYYNQASEIGYFENVYWVDSDKLKQGRQIMNPSDLTSKKVDHLLIAVENESVADEIKKIILDMKLVEDSKIIWLKPQICQGTYSYHYD